MTREFSSRIRLQDLSVSPAVRAEARTHLGQRAEAIEIGLNEAAPRRTDLQQLTHDGVLLTLSQEQRAVESLTERQIRANNQTFGNSLEGPQTGPVIDLPEDHALQYVRTVDVNTLADLNDVSRTTLLQGTPVSVRLHGTELIAGLPAGSLHRTTDEALYAGEVGIYQPKAL